MTLKLNGSSSGYTAIDAPAAAGSNTLVLPADNGSNGEFLKTNGSGTLDWAEAGGGKVVKHGFATYSTQHSTTNTSFQDTGLSLSYTPLAANNLIYVLCMQQCYMWNNGSGDGRAQWQLLEGSNVLALTQFECSGSGSSLEVVGNQPLQGRFTAANTNAVTIKTQYRKVSAGGAAAPHTQHGNRASNMIVVELEP